MGYVVGQQAGRSVVRGHVVGTCGCTAPALTVGHAVAVGRGGRATTCGCGGRASDAGSDPPRPVTSPRAASPPADLFRCGTAWAAERPVEAAALVAPGAGAPSWGDGGGVQGLALGRARFGRSVAPSLATFAGSAVPWSPGPRGGRGEGAARARAEGAGRFAGGSGAIETRLSGDYCARTLAVGDAREVARLSHCRIRLGEAPRFVEDSCFYQYDSAGNRLPWGGYYLEAEVPEFFDGMATFEEMLRAYVPDWYETVFGTSAWVDRAGQSLRQLDARLIFGGKNWTSDVCGNAVAIAIAQVQAYAHLAEGPSMFSGPCGLTAVHIRDEFEKGRVPIHVLACGLDGWRQPCIDRMELRSSGLFLDESGSLTASRDTGDTSFIGLTAFGGIYLHAGFLVNAAIADYYFWWARRLLAAGSLNQSFIGYLCARAAIAELSEIGEVIVHELGHLIGGVAFHCGTPPLSKTNCCNYVSQYLYFHRMAAEVGHSMGHFWWGAERDSSESRFMFGFGRTLAETDDECPEDVGPGAGGSSRPLEWSETKVFDYYHIRGGGCRDGYEGCHVALTARHADWWMGPHGLEVTWEFRDGGQDASQAQLDWRECQDPADLCVRDGDPLTGTIVYNGGL